MNDLLLEPGDLAGLKVSADSPLAGSPLLVPSASARPVAQGAELHLALQTLASPSLVVAGLRGARRQEPWPFFVCRQGSGPAVLLAPEEGGSARLRFAYSQEELVDWLAGPFRRFLAPQIACPEIPPLAPTGLAVMLAVVDLFGQRYPDLDPDWQETEPIVFGVQEILADGAGSLMNGLVQLGLPTSESLSLDTVESLLYMFANEGYLDVDVSLSTPLFRMTEAFLGTPLSLAWWDLSMSLESTLGVRPEPIRLIQGLALWKFVVGQDRRISMRAVSGEQLETEIRALFTSSGCSRCGKPLKSGVKFCGICGARAERPGCPKCAGPLDADAKFCPQCGLAVDQGGADGA